MKGPICPCVKSCIGTRFQTGNHFHLEQPVGSELLLQPELEQVRYRTLTTVFDMCEVGNLNWKGEPLRKRTIILTTSRQMHRSLDCRYCSKGHTHRQIAGQVKTDGVWIPFAAKYTASFAKAVIRVVQSNHDELPLLREELNISIEGNEVDQVLVGEAIKRPPNDVKTAIECRTPDGGNRNGRKTT